MRRMIVEFCFVLNAVGNKKYNFLFDKRTSVSLKAHIKDELLNTICTLFSNDDATKLCVFTFKLVNK